MTMSLVVVVRAVARRVPSRDQATVLATLCRLVWLYFQNSHASRL
jgi:hypothetical protein